MKSILIGISRPGDADGVPLLKTTQYVARCGSSPEVTFSIDCKQLEFFDNVKGLRYNDGDPSSSAGAISFFQKLMSDIFNNFQYLVIENNDKSPLHIRLITTPMELAQLPFEFIPAPMRTTSTALSPLLADPERIITLTREVLQLSEARYIWPKQPRILFAWAKSPENVPHVEHKNALIEALKPLLKPDKRIPIPEPDTEPFLTELPNATLESISKEIKKAIKEEKNYSHVHILAHGGHVGDLSGIGFRLLLCNEDPEVKEAVKVDGENLINAIIPDKKGPVPIVVTLSACDSANMGNVLEPSGSLVYQLHRAGIPCVFASQFPLTQLGSVDLVKCLYSDLINAKDPREALYWARLKLKSNNSHDWASLVAYARFPEDINEQLHAIRLKMLFTSMKTTGIWVDNLVKHKSDIEADKREYVFKQIEKRLDRSIEELSAYLNPDKESNLETASLRSEHLGLLASAYKRKAEFLYQSIDLNTDTKDNFIVQSTSALKAAKDFYYGGYDADVSSHWNAMQYLSLKAILGGSLEKDEELWNFILHIAKRNEEKAEKAKKSVEKIWSWGTLAELYLLKPLTVAPDDFTKEVKPATNMAKGFLRKIAELGTENAEIPDLYKVEKESTARQFERYIHWWPDIYPNKYSKELKEMAINIRTELPELDVLLKA